MTQSVGVEQLGGGHARAFAARAKLLRVLGLTLLGILILAPMLWVLVLAPTTGKWATSFGSAVHDPKDFLITLLNGVTAAALYFVVSSGFTLIFGLMRVVNMAHGAFFLFGGYVALKLQRHFVGEGGSFGLTSAQVNLTHWIVPALVGTAVVAAMGLVMQQLFLRWNQGQDLRQALITIAISIILADQMLAHFGGIAEDIAWPRNWDTFVNLRVAGRAVHRDAARDPRRWPWASACSSGCGSSARAPAWSSGRGSTTGRWSPRSGSTSS